MADYLTTDTDLTAVADAIRAKGGTSAALEYPDGFVSAIDAISTGGGSTGPVTNPLQGATIDAASAYTYQYEFDSTYGTPDYVYLTTVVIGGYYDWGTGTNTGPSKVKNKATVDSSGLLTVAAMSGSTTANAHYAVVISFIWGTFWEPTMAAADTFLIGFYDNPCYLRGTPITLADGTTKPVEQVTYDDELLVWDFDNGCHATAYPLWVKRRQEKVGYYHLTFASGKTLDVVGMDGKAHRLLDMDGTTFESSTDLVWHHVASIDGVDELVSCECVDEPCEFYNIVTSYHINCYAGGILTSCRYNNIYPIEGMRFVKEPREIVPFDAYDVPREFYDGMRLGEQTIDPATTNDYVGRMLRLI